MESQERNLNPHKPAKVAMYLFSDKYAKQGGGSMDFWDSLPRSKKNICRQLVLDLDKTRQETLEEIKLALK